MKYCLILSACSVFVVGCKGTVEVNCSDEPNDPACIEICRTNPTDSHCPADGGLDAGPGDAGPGDAGADTPDVPTTNCTTACGGETPVCDEDNSECVQCLAPTDCDGVEGRDMCLENTCAECADSTQCGTAEASRCEEDGLCGACFVNADCMGVMDAETNALSRCDTTRGAGVCVGCTEESAADDCGDFSCNPATQLCTETERGDVLDCGRCVGDEDCNFAAGFRCVPMVFDGAPRPDGYCLKLESESCAQPYVIAIEAESLSGADETTYCGIDQGATTCDAVRALRASRPCTDGAGGQDVSLCADAGARCEMVGLANDRCTIPCGIADNCPVGLGCDGEYCGSSS